MNKTLRITLLSISGSKTFNIRFRHRVFLHLTFFLIML
ncbi:M23 family peptidase, partial [Vibrio cholerae]|nr:M23 family peptidase [Vibrio cholerae]